MRRHNTNLLAHEVVVGLRDGPEALEARHDELDGLPRSGAGRQRACSAPAVRRASNMSARTCELHGGAAVRVVKERLPVQRETRIGSSAVHCKAR